MNRKNRVEYLSRRFMQCTTCQNALLDGAMFCDQCGASVREEDIKKPLAISVGTVTAITLTALIVHVVNENTAPPSTYKPITYAGTGVLEGMVDDMKEGVTFPLQLDAATTLTDISVQGEAIRYHYTLTGVDTTSYTSEYLKQYFSTGVCQTPEILNLLNMNIGIEYDYTVSETDQKYLLSYTKADCE